MSQTPSEVLQIKAAVRERDGMRCTKCGITATEHKQRKGRTLDVHRIVPGSEYSLNGCFTVCQACHGPLPRKCRGLENSRYLLLEPIVVDAIFRHRMKLSIKRRRRVSQREWWTEILSELFAEEIAELQAMPPRS